MTGEPGTTTATTAAQRAEDRTEGGGGRLVAWLVTPFAAVVPWLLMVGGALLVVAALLWAVLTAWSSSGTTVAGLATLAAGLFVATRAGASLVAEVGREGPVTLQTPLYSVANETVLLPLGAVLLAAGLGAAGARRLARRRR
ncbi:hypothetical protein ACQBJO_01230 [Janibacter sp. G349]|uniref:hypothetical protein n=1 Tax=unclassified Janibacter TaxID=2649294 RepID=UPI003B819CA7